MTGTPTATMTATEALIVVPTATATLTSSAAVAPVVTQRSSSDNGDGEDDEGMPLFLLIFGGTVTVLIGGYAVVYALSAAAIERYAEGFVIRKCPACEVGNLEVEERIHRVLGIPRVRRTVRCDNCRSVLRQVSKGQWRYAVDPAANPDLYRTMNGRVLREPQIMKLSPEGGDEMPQYVDED